MGLSYTLLREWSKNEGAWRSGLDPEESTLLLSPGSMTRDLEALLGSRVEVEVSRNGFTALDEEAGRCLGLGEGVGKKAFEREVWLIAGGKSLVYARSVIPVDTTREWVLKALEAAEPMGRILASNNVRFVKENIELGVVRCEEVAEGLGMDAATPLVARRYILSGKDPAGTARVGGGGGGGGGGSVIRAAVTEIFGKDILGGKLLANPCTGSRYGK